jgi:hypothetical protein
MASAAEQNRSATNRADGHQYHRCDHKPPAFGLGGRLHPELRNRGSRFFYRRLSGKPESLKPQELSQREAFPHACSRPSVVSFPQRAVAQESLPQGQDSLRQVQESQLQAPDLPLRVLGWRPRALQSQLRVRDSLRVQGWRLRAQARSGEPSSPASPKAALRQQS